MDRVGKVKSEWDTHYATYFWQIHLDKNHPYNSVPTMTGYSKKINQSEAQDKDYLLKRKISMLHNRGYLGRSNFIEIFMKASDIIDKNREPKILVLYRDHYDIPELNHDVIYKKHGSWLQSFYSLVNAGKPIDSILPAVRKGVSKDEFLDVHKQNHPTVSHLYAHATRLLRHGHSEGEVQNYIRKYKELKGPNFK